MKNLSLAWKTSLPLILFSFVLVMVMALFLFTLGRAQVNGPIYDRIVEGKDVIADVLPPPLYVVEADHLAWKLAATAEPSAQQLLVTAIREQKTGPGGLDERRQYWATRLEAGEVRTALLDQVLPTAETYFQTFESQVVPALNQGGAAVRDAVAGPLSQAFEAHRNAVAHVVTAANAGNEVREASSRAEVLALTTLTLVISGVGFIVAVLLSLFMARQMTTAIHKLLLVAEGVVAADQAKIAAARALSLGDLTVVIPPSGVDVASLNQDRRDEIGRLHRAFGGIARSQSDLAEALASVSDGLRALVGDIRIKSEDVAEGARQVADASQQLSDGASTQAAAVEQVSSAMTTIGGQVKANADRADQAKGFSAQADQTVQEGLKQMGSLVLAMNTLETSSVEVVRVVKVIDDIAFQVNLLSLNAAVEAARAGQHGRGFAVVAQEVRSLATSSAKAAHETEALIRASLDQIRQGVTLTRQNSEVLERIGETVSKTGHLVNEIAAASRVQDQNVQQVIQSLGQIEAVTQSNTATAEETAAASVDLTGKSGELKRLTQRFQLG